MEPLRLIWELSGALLGPWRFGGNVGASVGPPGRLQRKNADLVNVWKNTRKRLFFEGSEGSRAAKVALYEAT